MSASSLPKPHMSIVPHSDTINGIYPIPDSPVVMLVTPAIATDWLDNRNINNRSKSLVTTKRYVRAINANRWKCTHQGIAFNRDGFLVDGQHRLMAIASSGVPVKLFVIPFVDGMDEDTFDVLDNGHKRNAGQLLPGTAAHARAAAARYLGVVDDSFGPEHNIMEGIIAKRVETVDVLEVVKAWDAELTEWAGSVSTPAKAAGLAPGVHLAVLAQAERSSYRDRIPSWLEGINSGAGLEADDPRLLVRNRFLSDKTLSGGSGAQCISYRLIVKAWNAHATRATMKQLKSVQNEAVPRVVGLDLSMA